MALGQHERQPRLSYNISGQMIAQIAQIPYVAFWITISPIAGPEWSGLAASPCVLAIDGDPPPYDFLP